jgi:hypothetical protein
MNRRKTTKKHHRTTSSLLWNTEAKREEKKKQQSDTQIHTPVFTHLIDTVEKREKRKTGVRRRTTYRVFIDRQNHSLFDGLIE